MRRRTLRTIIASLTALTVMAIFLAGILYYFLFSSQFYPQQTVYIYIGAHDSATSVYQQVQRIGKAHNMTGFKWLASYRKYDQHMRTGRYAIYPQDNAYQVFHRIYRGHQTPINFTIGSVRTLDKLAKSLGKQLMIDSAEIARQMNDSLFYQKLGYQKESLPCLFIPNTYEVYWNISVDALFQRLQKEHERFWNQSRLEKAKAIGMTPEEVGTLASIVEEETNNKTERPIVAGLYINRLHKGMPLQADPTIKFAVQDFGLRRITQNLLQTDSPYNTYQNPGLPPGPIRIPTPAGIDAVLNYTKHSYLYMCAKEDFSGTHNFASSYTAHMNNARKYWNALNRRKIFK